MNLSVKEEKKKKEIPYFDSLKVANISANDTLMHIHFHDGSMLKVQAETVTREGRSQGILSIGMDNVLLTNARDISDEFEWEENYAKDYQFYKEKVDRAVQLRNQWNAELKEAMEKGQHLLVTELQIRLNTLDQLYETQS